MSVFGTNTSVGTFLAFQPFSSSGFHPLSQKMSAFRPSSLLAMPSRRT